MEITTLTNEEEEMEKFNARRTGTAKTDGLAAPKQTRADVILKRLKKTAMQKCEPAVREFVDCSKHRTVTLFFSCRELNKKMNACLAQFTTDTDRDILREEALKQKIAARKSRGVAA
ncbi:cytochrome c oxidase biogenesis protein Cmc1 like-domain-containing protein [Chytridium lagenaria]|nr:cytochrome c oxidase biogenesis protein Cmc1 like-domain-containing protein [Chytridium lagenaria]